MTLDLQEMDDRWLLGWRGLVVTDVESQDDSLVLRLGDAANLTIEHGAAATVAASLTGQRVRASLSGLRMLVGSEVLSVVGFKSGAVRLIVEDGRRLDVGTGAVGLAWSARTDGYTWRSVGGKLETSRDA